MGLEIQVWGWSCGEKYLPLAPGDLGREREIDQRKNQRRRGRVVSLEEGLRWYRPCPPPSHQFCNRYLIHICLFGGNYFFLVDSGEGAVRFSSSYAEGRAKWQRCLGERSTSRNPREC